LEAISFSLQQIWHNWDVMDVYTSCIKLILPFIMWCNGIDVGVIYVLNCEVGLWEDKIMNWNSILLGGIAFMLSYFTFFIFYKKLGIAKWINKKLSKAIVAIFITFVLYLVAMSIIRTTNIAEKYYNIFQGFFLGLPISIIPHIFSKNKRNNS
jgi:hypothetical protein